MMKPKYETERDGMGHKMDGTGEIKPVLLKHIVTLHADGTRSETYQKKASLEILQKEVGGYIETVPCFGYFEGKPCEVYCNEEGKLNGLAFNAQATIAWQKCNPTIDLQDVLVGDIAVVFKRKV